MLFLESIILDKDCIDVSMVPESNNHVCSDQSLHDLGSRPTIKYVEQFFEGLSFQRYDDVKLDSHYQPLYSKPPGNTESLVRRFWVITC